MKELFFKYWFKGFDEALDNINENDKNEIFKYCGRACSDSYTKQIYVDEFVKADNINDFIKRLMKRFPEIEYQIIKDNEEIILMYRFCACDLVKDGYISNPSLCECSRQSLLYNWGTVIGESNVDIKLMKSILNGDDCCQFNISISTGG